MIQKLRRHLPLVIVAVAVVLLLVVLVLWWLYVWQSPKHVFEGMLHNNLKTSSVTRFGQASGNGQSIEQSVRLQLGSTNAADWLVSISQGNASHVTSESIGTPHDGGYVRYTDIDTTQKRTNGKQYDFSSVLNVWGKSGKDDVSSLNQLFSQSLLDIGTAPMPPIGNLSSEDRQAIMGYIVGQKVFTPSYKNVKHEVIDGTKVYTYDVTVQLGPYVRMMQAFASNLGLTTLQTVDASQYVDAKPVKLTFSVDPVSHQLVRVSYPEAGYSETYSDWGLQTPITIPKQTIPVGELQSRLQAVER